MDKSVPQLITNKENKVDSGTAVILAGRFDVDNFFFK